MTGKTYTYTFRDGQKEAYEEHLRKTADLHRKAAMRHEEEDDPRGADLRRRRLRETESLLARAGAAEDGTVTLSRRELRELEVFAYSRGGRGLFSDGERASLKKLVRG